MPTPLDLRLAARTAAITALLGAVTLLVMARTDESENTWGDRLLRLAAAAPALAALAASLVTRQLLARGEIRALALSGASPLRRSLGIAAGGALVGIPSVLAGVSLSPSLRALLPLVSASPWIVTPRGFLAPALGLLLDHPGNSIQYLQPTSPSAPPQARWIIAAALALASVLAPWWAALPCAPWPRVAVGTAAVLGMITAFHMIALGWSGALLLLPCALLLGHLLMQRRGG